MADIKISKNSQQIYYKIHDHDCFKQTTLETLSSDDKYKTTDIKISKIAKFYCENCDYKCCKTSAWQKHLLTDKHQTTYTKIPKNPQILYCDKCHYKCSKQSDWKKHISTDKHKMADKYLRVSQSFQCLCGKKYSHRQSLHKHKCSCNFVVGNDTINEEIDINLSQMQPVTIDQMTSLLTPEMFVTLLQQNKELQVMVLNQSKDCQQILIEQNNKLLELLQNSGSHYNNCSNNNINNSNNKTFNLQFFLNETCKNAINMSEFIQNIKISLEDLEETGRVGYAEGISKLFIKNLNNLEIKDRPIHCSDSKRDTLYIKNENVWTKDDDDNKILTNAIREVSKKNSMQISEWRKKYPKYNDPESRESDNYQKMIFNTMPGSSKEECDKNYIKIAKNIAKKVIIEK